MSAQPKASICCHPSATFVTARATLANETGWKLDLPLAVVEVLDADGPPLTLDRSAGPFTAVEAERRQVSDLQELEDYDGDICDDLIWIPIPE